MVVVVKGRKWSYEMVSGGKWYLEVSCGELS